MPTPFIYSPFDPLHYRIQALPICEASSIESLPDAAEAVAVWNLFWLSVPSIDSLLVHGADPNWNRHYTPVDGALGAITADAIADDPLRLKLLLHPTRFIDFFTHQDHSIFDCYYALGGKKWVDTVLRRATLAAERIGSWSPDWQHGEANVYSITGRSNDPLRGGDNLLQIPGADSPPPTAA